MRDGLQGDFDIIGKFLVNGFKYFLQMINIPTLILNIPLQQREDFLQFCPILL
jgi:hypothetical protein